MSALPPFTDPASQSLATAPLPPRVRVVLGHALNTASEELERQLATVVTDLEQQLFRLSEQARNSALQAGYMQTLRTLRTNRSDLVPRFMIGLEASLASIGARAQAAAEEDAAMIAGRPSYQHMSLVEENEMDEEAVLRRVAVRLESRASLTLHLLGQRFGVLAGSPAFDAARLPLGPQSLCQIMHEASQCLHLPLESRLLLYHAFEHRLMAAYPQMLELLNAAIAADGVLPSLTYVPFRARPTEQGEAEAAAKAAIEPVKKTRRNGKAGARSDADRTVADVAGGSTAGGGGAGSSGGGSSGGGSSGGGGSGGGGSGGGGSGGGGSGGGGSGGGAEGSAGRGAGGARSAARPSRREGDIAADGTRRGEDASADRGLRKREGTGRRRGDSARQYTYTGWLGQPDDRLPELDEGAAIDLLQHLLSGRRELLGKLRPDVRSGPFQQLETLEVVSALGAMRETAPAGTKRNVLDIKQALLAQMRQQRGHGTSLQPRDSDTFELLDMLYAQVEREVRGDTPAATLLHRLQVPVLRLALQDRSFFTSTKHPARQLLNAVAESGARWLDHDDVEPQLLLPLKRAVDHVVEKYDGNPAVFEASNRDLQAELQTLARKAETAERRHVEAARGKEKLEIAKSEAAKTITDIIGEQTLPKFVRALLNQAWADVLTLTLLRQGSDSETWQKQLDVTRRIVGMSVQKSPPDPSLAGHIEAALAQVGYHAEEAAAIARRLTSALEDDEEDPASRTELTMRLKARVRLGEDTIEKRKPELPPRTPEEEAQHDLLKVMPYGTWIEFVINQQGDVVRRRMSWYSPMTDNALFVNQRGRRVSEQSLDSVARLLASGQAKVVAAESGRLVDRAWQATLSTLRSFAGRGTAEEPAEDGLATGDA